MIGSARSYSIISAAIALLLIGGMFFILYRPVSSKKITLNGQQFYVDIADEEAERIQGLSGREPLNHNEGMLFVFDEPQEICLWMKDMRFSIDILWFNEHKQLIQVKNNISPDTYPDSFCSTKPAKYVLELSAGSAERKGLQPNHTQLEAVAF